MAITPRFSAQRFSRTLSAATGMASGALKNTLSRFGKQSALTQGTTATETKIILRQLEKSGAIEDARAAERVFNKENRIAERVAKTVDQGRREDRLAEYKKEQEMGGLVRQQKHSVSVFGDSATSHAVTAFGGGAPPRASVSSATVTKTSVGMAGGSPLQMSKPVQTPPAPKPVLKDIPFD